MRILVTYMSLSGNTRKLADMIYASIDGPKDLQQLSEVQSLEGYDLTFIGFPVHQFGAPEAVKEFVERNAKGRNIALFVTHAMPPGMDMLKGIMRKCQAPFAEARVLGSTTARESLPRAWRNRLSAAQTLSCRSSGGCGPLPSAIPMPLRSLAPGISRAASWPWCPPGETVRTLVTYLSSSGNTRRVAEAIHAALPGSSMMAMADVGPLDGHDLIFAGFPVIAEGSPRRAKRFLRRAQGRRVALFLTHGMPASMSVKRGI